MISLRKIPRAYFNQVTKHSEKNTQYQNGIRKVVHMNETYIKELEQALKEIQAITKGLIEFNATYEKIHNIAGKALSGGNTHD